MAEAAASATVCCRSSDGGEVEQRVDDPSTRPSTCAIVPLSCTRRHAGGALAGSIAAPNTHLGNTRGRVDTGVLARAPASPELPRHPPYRGEATDRRRRDTVGPGYTWSTLLTADEVLRLGRRSVPRDWHHGKRGDAAANSRSAAVLTTTRLNFRTARTHNSVIRVLATDTVLTLTDGPVANGYVGTRVGPASDRCRHRL